MCFGCVLAGCCCCPSELGDLLSMRSKVVLRTLFWMRDENSLVLGEVDRAL